MERYEIFISKPEQLPSAFKCIQKQKMPSRFDREFLIGLGFTKRDAILYIRLFKNLELVKKNGQPHPVHYSRFLESDEQAKTLLGRQMKDSAYAKVFEVDPNAHNMDEKEIRALFQTLMGSKSETIVKMAADTFNALVEYANWNVPQETDETGEEGTEEISPQEEFILELIHGVEDHPYPSDASSPVTAGEHEASPQSEPPAKKSEPVNAVPQSSAGWQNLPGVETNNNHSSLLAQALLRRAELLEQLNRPDDAVQAYDDIINFADGERSSIDEEEVFNACFKKAALLDQMEHYEEALSSYDQLIYQYKETAA